MKNVSVKLKARKEWRNDGKKRINEKANEMKSN